MPTLDTLPTAVIGAGPVGLAAAAHLARRGLPFVVLERGGAVGAALREWAHVRVFSPWSINIDAAARAMLEAHGWRAPDPAGLPTGGEIVRDYLEPLAALPQLAPHILTGAEVVALSRDGVDKRATASRAAASFVVRWRGRDGEHRLEARAVIDASGTWGRPNPMGADGLPVDGEVAANGRLAYGIPDVLGRERADYGGARVLVVGGGHSAMNTVLELIALRRTAPATRILWALRRGGTARLGGGGADDMLPARAALGGSALRAITTGEVELLAPFAAAAVERRADALRVTGIHAGVPVEIEVDRIVVATGFRPDTTLFRELRVALDPALEAPPALAPLIDPNVHSCGTVPPHGVAELAHPEPGFYIAGTKSYGRAPTFLMTTGYEQVRSIVAELAGDHVAARRVELALPGTGVCGGTAVAAASACCGGPVPDDPDACCVRDAEAKAAGETGCGCGTKEPEVALQATKACCGTA